MKEIHFIETKLKIPSEGKNILVREKLIQNIISNITARLIIINAPGGYGKTILAAQLVNELKLPCIWYHLDEADNDPVIFFNYLFHALNLLDKQDKEASIILNSMENGVINFFYMASLFLDKIREMKKKVAFVLDDMHLLNDPGILDFLNILFKYLPDNLYIIVTSRYSLKLDILKLITSDLAVELNKKDIRFTYEEFIDLMNMNSQTSFNNYDINNLKAIYEKSEGWIMPLSFCMKIINKSEDQRENAYKVLQSQEPFNKFFTAQIFDNLLPEEKDFLLCISVLDRMTVDACAYVSGYPNAKEILQNLSDEKNILTVQSGTQNYYSCHQLIHDFLLEKLGNKAEELFSKAGDYYYIIKYYNEAIEYYIKGKNPDKADNSLRYAGIDMIRNGRMKTVERWLNYFDGINYDNHRGVLLTKAFVSLYKGAFDQSEGYLKKLQFRNENTVPEEDYNIEQVIQSRILLYRHSLKECIDCADRIIMNMSRSDPYTTYEAFMNKAYGQILMGDFDDSITTLEAGIEQMKCNNSERLAIFLERYLIVPYYLKFQYNEALHYSELVVELTDEEINLTERYSIDLYCARLYRDLGRNAEAKALMDKILIRKHALGYEEDIFAVYYHYATLLRDMGEFDQALRFASLSEELFKNSGSNMEFTHLVKALKALIFSDMGRNKEAFDLASSALSKLLKGSSKFMVEVAYFSAGIVAIRNMQLTQAEQFLNAGYEMSLKMSLKSMVPVCAGLLVYIYIHNNKKRAVDMALISLTNNAQQDYLQVYLTNPEMDECIAIGLIHGYEIEFISKLINRLNQKRINHIFKLLMLFGEDDNIKRFLKEIVRNGKPVDETFRTINLELFSEEKNLQTFLNSAGDIKLLNEDTPKLIVSCFGEFQLYNFPYDGKVMKWRTQKAKELMAYFIHNAGRVIRTEQILADLWPDTEVNKARDIFYTSIAIVRKTLEMYKLKQNLIKAQLGYFMKKDHIICDEWLIEESLKNSTIKDSDVSKLLQKGYLMEFYSDWVIELRNYYINI